MSRFIGQANYQHDRSRATGILITNLGTPDAPTAKALRRYLAEFLADPRVVEIPRLIWMLILHGIILRTRPARSAKAYKEVWREQGSPLLIYSRQQLEAIKAALEPHFEGPVEFALGMRYGKPSIPDALAQLQQANVGRLLVLPLYPQYSGSTGGSTFDKVAQTLQTWRYVPELRFINHYHDDPGYINAMAEHIKRYWREHGRGDKLLLSFHGVPKFYLLKGDPYHCECHKTARLLAQSLGLQADEWLITFQSRFGKAEWLKPYTDETIKQLPAKGVKHLQVFCPGFSADCLETLEEIAGENKEYFIEAGGLRFDYISALNAELAHIQALTDLIKANTQGWQGAVASTADLAQAKQDAMALGAEQ